MRRNLGVKAALYPMPVFILATYNDDGTPNAMTAAWGGISEENEVTICISDDHQTTFNIEKRNAFTINIGDADHVKACDYLGIVSGKNVHDKVARAGFTVTASGFVDAPIINELGFAVECKVKSWEPERCRLVGEIVNISVDEAIYTDGKVDLKKLRPITYDSLNKSYHVIGEKVGNAYKDGLELK